MSHLHNIQGAPFSKSSAEEERHYLKDIFYKQQYYDTLVDLAEASSSRFILGQRGQGKSAMVLHLMDDMRDIGVLPILIDQYDGFPDRENKNYFLYTMIYRLTFELAEYTMQNPKLLKLLNLTQQQQFGTYIEMFYDPMTAQHCVECAESIAKKRRGNKIKTFVNNHLTFLNDLIGFSVKVGADLLKGVTGLGNVDTSVFGGEYLKECKLESYKQIPMSIIVSWDATRLKQILLNLRDMALAMNVKSIAFMFDKIDEISGINGQIDRVTSFMTDFLSDTGLLYTDKIAIIVSLWSEVKKAINKQGIRFDKFKEVDIRWTNEELVELLNKRLLYFSIDKTNPVRLDTLVTSKQDIETILMLSDKSPRSLFSLMEYIQSEEKSSNGVVSFSPEALSKGYIKYCKRFDYTSAQPSRTGKGTDVTDWIVRLLRTRMTVFSQEQYKKANTISKNVAVQHIDTMLKYNLIKDSLFTTEDGDALYKVADPRIEFLIARNEISLEL